VTPAIASKLASKSPYIFLATGWGGTYIAEWSQDKSILSDYTNKELQHLEKKGHKLSVVIWIQGENEAYRDKDASTKKHYISHFNIMKSKFLRGLSNKQNVKFVITQTSRCNEMPRDRQLNKQQLHLGKDKNSYVTEVTDNLGPEYRYDNCHLNELGVEATAEEISYVLNNILDE